MRLSSRFSYGVGILTGVTLLQCSEPCNGQYLKNLVKKMAVTELSDNRIGMCWGDNIFGQVSRAPDNLNEAEAVVTGLYHNFAQYVNEFGKDSSECWGMIVGGQQCAPPTESYEVVTAGYEATCFITKSTDRLVCKGWNDYGQCDVPSDLGAVVDADMFHRHTCAIKESNNKVFCWGYNDYGQASVPADVEEVSSVNTGSFNTCVILMNDEIVCWGSDEYAVDSPPSSLGTVSAVEVGKNHACAIQKSTQQVVCWGQNDSEQRTVPADLGAVTAITAGEDHNCAIQASTGAIKCWGNNIFGQTSVPSAANAGVGFLNVSAGASHTCAWGMPQTLSPTFGPTFSPTENPTKTPSTSNPTSSPTENPTKTPSTSNPTSSPTKTPTKAPASENPTFFPTNNPTKVPTVSPVSQEPTNVPTFAPTMSPTISKSPSMSMSPSALAVDCCSTDGSTCSIDLRRSCQNNKRRCENRRCQGSWITVNSSLATMSGVKALISDKLNMVDTIIPVINPTATPTFSPTISSPPTSSSSPTNVEKWCCSSDYQSCDNEMPKYCQRSFRRCYNRLRCRGDWIETRNYTIPEEDNFISEV